MLQGGGQFLVFGFGAVIGEPLSSLPFLLLGILLLALLSTLVHAAFVAKISLWRFTIPAPFPC